MFSLGEAGTGEKIKTGMIFTIEPMINLGSYETKTLNDGWTAVTKDKSLSAQFEHTIGAKKMVVKFLLSQITIIFMIERYTRNEIKRYLG